MKPIYYIIVAAAVSGCSLGANRPEGHTPPTIPPVTKECTGPGPQNFNGAELTQALIDRIPRQFISDRKLLKYMLDTYKNGQTPPSAYQEFAHLCHGLILTDQK